MASVVGLDGLTAAVEVADGEVVGATEGVPVELGLGETVGDEVVGVGEGTSPRTVKSVNPPPNA